MKKISRRSFIQRVGITAAATSSLPLANLQAMSNSITNNRSGNTWPGRGVLNFNENAVQFGQIQYTTVKQMVDESIQRLTDKSDTVEAWEAVFPDGIAAGDKIAIKVNASYQLKNTEEVLKAVVEGLTSMLSGAYPASNITVFDHGGPSTISFSSLYDISGIKFSDASDGRPHTDSNAGNRNYPDCLEQAKYMIDLPVLKTHQQSWSGAISITFKGQIGTYKSGHSGFDSGDLVELRSGVVKEKCCLCIVDGIKGTQSGYNGAAEPFPDYAEAMVPGTSQTDPCTIIMSSDPATTDYLARNIFRIDMDNPNYGSGSDDIVAAAENAGLGIGDESDPNWDYREIINGVTTNKLHQAHTFTSHPVGVINNHPNPAQTHTTIKFRLPKQFTNNALKLQIYRANGARVKDANLSPRTFRYFWDLKDDNNAPVANGTYNYRLISKGYTLSGVMIVKR